MSQNNPNLQIGRKAQMISSRLSVRYAIVFALFAGGLVWVAITNGGAALILLWPGLSFLMVAVAYSGIGVAVFGKKNGRLPNRMGNNLSVTIPDLFMVALGGSSSDQP